MRAMPMKPEFPDVDAHVGAQAPAIRERVARFRGAVRTAAPAAVENFPYPMPAHALGSDSAFVAFVAQSRYPSLHAGRPEVLLAFAAGAGRLKAGKACLRRGPTDDLSPAALARPLKAIAVARRQGDVKSC